LQSDRSDNTQVKLLERVGLEIQGRLDQSLHNAVRLILDIERQDYQVQRPWGAMLTQIDRLSLALPAGTRVLEVFEQNRQQLLILGEPGSGKTTMLLELAEDLLKLALSDNCQPIPVLVNLSSWKDPKSSIFTWLLRELNLKYGLRADVATAYLRQNQLLPLLDGLDEVTTEHQKACAEAINAWITGDLDCVPCGVVICCRQEEYEQVVREPLSLIAAIYLQALTPDQITAYFEQFGLAAVDKEVRQDAALQAMLAKPLFLSMFGLLVVQEKFDLAAWQTSQESHAKITYLFEAYWAAAMERELITDPGQRQLGILSKTYGKRKLPNPESIRQSLVFIANGMTYESSTEFLIEDIQGDWLLNKLQRFSYSITSGVVYLLIAILINNSLAKTIYPSTPQLFIPWGTFLFGVVYSFMPIVCVDSIKFSFPPKIAPEAWGLGKIFAIASAIVLIPNLADPIAVPVTQIFSLFAMYFFGVLLGSRGEIDLRLRSNQGIKNSIRVSIIFSILSLLMAFLMKIPFELFASQYSNDYQDMTSRISFLLILFVVIAFREGGGNAVLQHIALRLVLWQNRYAPPRYDLLLNYCTERLLLQRIGGRYRFMHKLLQDHFAAMDLD
jgi:DNA polymerase III delta prime subunit